MEQQDGLNERLLEKARERADTLMHVGVAPGHAVAQAVEELAEGFEQHSEDVADGLSHATSEHLEERRESDVGFEERLSDAYGDAFNAYDTVVEVVAGAALDFWHRYRRSGQPDELTELLWGHLAQCLRVAREVGHLLRGGFPYGALSAHRTAYELAVRTTVLHEYGREPGYEGLAERYRLHDHIGQEADVREYQKNAEALGFDPMDESELEAAATRRSDLRNRFGKQFGTQYGWAVGLPGVTAGRFDEVERLAGISHRRGFYRWSSHFVHGDPSSLRMSIMRRGGISQGVLSDRTNVHLTDPAQFTLYALQLTYINATYSAPVVALADLFVGHGLPHLLDRAGHAFCTAEQSVMDAERVLEDQLADEPGTP